MRLAATQLSCLYTAPALYPGPSLGLHPVLAMQICLLWTLQGLPVISLALLCINFQCIKVQDTLLYLNLTHLIVDLSLLCGNTIFATTTEIYSEMLQTQSDVCKLHHCSPCQLQLCYKCYKSTDSSKENLVSGIIQQFLTLKPSNYISNVSL